MSVVVVATALPAEGHREEVLAAFERAVVTVHAEDAGCELYAIHEGKDRIVMIEKWASAGDLAAHGSKPALAALRDELADRLTAPLEVVVLTPHPAGTPEQGTL